MSLFNQDFLSRSFPSQNRSTTPYTAWTYVDQFDTDLWTHSGGDNTVSGGELNSVLQRAQHYSYYDIKGSAFSDTSWVMRVTARLSSVSITANPNITCPMGLRDVTTGTGSAADYIGIGPFQVAAGTWDGAEGDGVSMQSAQGAAVTGAVYTGAETRYLQIIRQSATLTDFQVYEDSDFSTLDNEALSHTTPSTNDGLRYAFIGGRNDAASETNTCTVHYDDLRFEDATTTPPSDA